MLFTRSIDAHAPQARHTPSPTRRPETSTPPLLFFRKFLRHGTRVASVAPSSRALARAMCRHVSRDEPQTILELGAGTGAVTRVAARKMHRGSRLIAFETDRDFARQVEWLRLPRTEVVAADAREADAWLSDAGIGRVDVVLCGLPTPSLPRAVNEAVLACLERVAGDGVFSQLTVMPWVYAPVYRRLFDRVDFQLVPLNVPPGGVYHCRGLQQAWRDHVPGKAAESSGTPC